MDTANSAGDNSPVVSLNGQIVSPASASISIFDSAVLAGCGVFETMLADGNYVYRQGQHLRRLERSTKALGIATRFDSNRIAEILSATLGHFNNQYAEKSIAESNRYRRIRVTLTGGNSGEGLWGAQTTPEPLPGSLIVIVQSHILPDESVVSPAEVLYSPIPIR